MNHILKVANDKYNMRIERTKWFREARFGMFIHWGLYAIPARGEWVMSNEKMTIKEYRKYFDEFNPESYNPREWAKLAKTAGMKYAVMTAKHHDGFCLFNSELTDYKSTNTLAGRDIIKEYVEAFREEGLKVGLYYSLVDWYHEDYPAYGDRQHPMRDNPYYKGKKHDFNRYLDYMHGQVKELCTNYGRIDIMWFDFSYWHMKGEAWRATELVNMIRTLQPHIIIDNRLGGNMLATDPEVYAGDFAGPEQMIPRECVRNEEGDPVPWEANMTLNDSWGYCTRDKNYKTPEFVIRTLVNCVSKGGNLLVNVGPDAKGEIPEESVKILEDVGKWMKKNGKSIYGCGEAQFEKPEWGRFTQRGNKVYAHILDRVIGHINLKGFKGKINKARLLSDGSEIILTDFWNAEAGAETFDNADDIYMNFGYPVHLAYNLPDRIDTVVELELK